MYLDKFAAFRITKETYDEFNALISNNPDIEDFSHGVRIALIRYMRELKEKKEQERRQKEWLT